MGKTALITGASGGIGRALCRAFAGASYRVVGTDLKAARLPGCAAFIAVDLERFSGEAAYRALCLKRLKAELPREGLAALVNNAAVQVLGRTQRLSAADWRRTLDVNVTAPFLLVQGLLRELERARGSVVQIASIHASLTKPGFAGYAASKAALIGLTRALAVDLGPRVRVNAVSPAATDTSMLRSGFKGRPGSLTRLAAMHPAGRIAKPDEVAQAVLFLASDRLPSLTGAVLGLDGGIGTRLHDPE